MRTATSTSWDRVKDAIRRRGENISSVEVEQEILAHPEVDQVAAVAVANPDVARGTGDEEVKVVIVRVAESKLTPEELTQYLVERMPRHWVPRFVEFAGELPRTAVVQGQEGRAARGGRDRTHVGPRARPGSSSGARSSHDVAASTTPPGHPRLVGARCRGCAEVMFPHRERCSACAWPRRGARVLLPERGTLWTWTVQGFMPPSPPFGGGDAETFEPFGVGYVELEGLVRVESRLAGAPETFRIGMDLELVELEVDGEALFAFACPGGSG